MKLRALHGDMQAGKGEEGEREGLMINGQEVTGSGERQSEASRLRLPGLGWRAAGFW